MQDPFQKSSIRRSCDFFTRPRFLMGGGFSLLVVGATLTFTAKLSADFLCSAMGYAMTMSPSIASKIAFAGLVLGAIGITMLVAGIAYACLEKRAKKQVHQPLVALGQDKTGKYGGTGWDASEVEHTVQPVN